MISFWERKTFTAYDFIIIGSGIVGLSTAASLKEKYPTATVLVLERGIWPTGASTKNAGFACIGSPTELLDDLSKMTEAEMLNLVEQRYKGLLKLRQRLGDENIDYQALGSYEMLGEKELHCLEHIDRLNTLLEPLLGGKAFSVNYDKIVEFGFNQDVVKALVINHFEGQIDTGKMMQALLHYVQALGVSIINGTKVLEFDETIQEGAQVVMRYEYMSGYLCLRAKHLFICTNAFTSQLLPDIDIKPGRGQVLVTKPIDNLRFKGIFHFDEGYYYFRNFGNRVIFGGGRNLDFKGEETFSLGGNYKIVETLDKKLAKIILPQTPYKLEMEWSGIMGFGENKIPLLERISDKISLGAKLGGMGVAIGSYLGEALAAQAPNPKTVFMNKFS